MGTYVTKSMDNEDKWVLIDATDKVLGRLSSNIANILMGKGSVKFARNVVIGDGVIVINAEKIKLTGQKMVQKVYYHHSGYPGGIKAVTAGELLDKHPERLIQHAVKGMLPKNKIGMRLINRLKVYVGSAHPHNAQVPEKIEIDKEG